GHNTRQNEGRVRCRNRPTYKQLSGATERGCVKRNRRPWYHREIARIRNRGRASSARRKSDDMVPAENTYPADCLHRRRIGETSISKVAVAKLNFDVIGQSIVILRRGNCGTGRIAEGCVVIKGQGATRGSENSSSRKVGAIRSLKRKGGCIACSSRSDDFDKGGRIRASDNVLTAIEHGRARVGVIAEKSRAIRAVHHTSWVEAPGLDERTIGKNACQLQRRLQAERP